MTRKNFSDALRKTAGTQKGVIDDRFAKADSVLLGMKPDASPEPAPVEVPPKVVPPVPPSVGAPDGGATKEGPPTEAPKGEAMVVRDTFSMPPSDHGLIEQLRVRAAREGRNTNKSEVVRAGLRALTSLPSAQLVELLEGLERVKPGRK